MNRLILISMIAMCHLPTIAAESWQELTGKAGPEGWRCNVIHPDPDDHGPDGINLHDWDGDGDLDVLSNAEEGRYSRLYFNPGAEKIRSVWTDFIEFTHGKCEDSGIGDLDNDGDIDYIANGGWIFFNPGREAVRDITAWKRMDLFDHERRVPVVTDIDGDGLSDLVVGAQEWYRQPRTGKHEARNWRKFPIGHNRWPMNCLVLDMDADGDKDMVVPDRGVDICWYENPGAENLHRRWARHQIHGHHEPMFMTHADINQNGRQDLIITGGSKGNRADCLMVLFRGPNEVHPSFTEMVIKQPCGNFPKGVTTMPPSHDGAPPEIFVIPKQGNIWCARYDEDAPRGKRLPAHPIIIPGAETRRKMDNAWTGDLDGDGDLDIVTTEENGGWGVIWFENPGTKPQR